MMTTPWQWRALIGVGLASLWLTSCQTQPSFVLERQTFSCPRLRCENASWSPQADQLVISANTGRKINLWMAKSNLGNKQLLQTYLNQDPVTAVEGSSFAALLHRYPEGSYNTPVWSPTGEEIAFFLSGGVDAPGIYRVNLISGETTLAVARPPVLEFFVADYTVRVLSWSADGQQLHYAEEAESEAGYLINRLNVTTGQTETLHTSPSSIAALSPDGQQLAYLTGTTAAPDVWLLALDTGATRALTTDGATQAETNLAWSPDGRFLLLTTETSDPEAQYQLTLLQVADGRQLVVETGHHYDYGFLAWSADGQWIVLTELHPKELPELVRLKVNPQIELSP